MAAPRPRDGQQPSCEGGTERADAEQVILQIEAGPSPEQQAARFAHDQNPPEPGLGSGARRAASYNTWTHNLPELVD